LKKGQGMKKDMGRNMLIRQMLRIRRTFFLLSRPVRAGENQEQNATGNERRKKVEEECISPSILLLRSDLSSVAGPSFHRVGMVPSRGQARRWHGNASAVDTEFCGNAPILRRLTPRHMEVLS
jgi:hypothetical protein